VSDFFWLIPLSVAMGIVGLVVFLWTLRRNQYDDLDGAAERILYDDDVPLDAPRQATSQWLPQHGSEVAQNPRSGPRR
jgi:cbb3-type cytochrome oxidase maturation protein